MQSNGVADFCSFCHADFLGQLRLLTLSARSLSETPGVQGLMAK